MKFTSRAKISAMTVVATVLLIVSMTNIPARAGGQPSSDYPVVVSLGGVDRVFFATHTSSKVDGNWIELSGGTMVELPSLNFVYTGTDVDYSIGDIRVKMKSDFIPDLTYPLSTHRVYKAGDSVSAKFWGSPDFGSQTVDVMLLRVSSLSDIIDVLEEASLGNILTLLDSLVKWESITLNSYGDGTYNFDAPAAGDYILVVAKIDYIKLEVYAYSATAIEVVDYTLDIDVDSSVEKGDPLYVNSKLASEPAGSYIHAAALIKKSAYKGEIKLTTDGTVPNTEIYVNGELMADGSLFTDFFLGTQTQADITIDLIQEKLMKAFDTDELAFGYTTATHTGSMSLSTGSLSTGNYVLLVGVWKDFETRIVGLKQTTVTVTKYKPSPEPSPGKPNMKPKADAGPNQKISMGSTLYLSGAGSDDPDGVILSYSWDFGDGNTASNMEVDHVDHVYSDPGIYVVTLTVKDNRGAEDFDKCTVMVWEPPAPVAYKFGEIVPGEQKGFKVDASEAANTIVTLDTTDQVTVTILRYEENPHPDDPMPADALPIYVDVEVSDPDAVEWPIYVEMFYTDEEAEGLDEDSLGIYYWKDGEWRRCSDTGVYTERNVVWAYMTMEEASGSPILIGGIHAIPTPPLPPYLSDLTINPEELELGGDVTISFLIQNMDSQSLTYYTTMQIGELSLLVDTDLEPYESKTVTRIITPDKVGDYNVTVIGLTGSFTVKPLPIPLKPAEFVVTDLTVSPTEVSEGEEVTVSVTVTNVGDVTGTHTLEIKIDEETPEGPPIETALEGGASKTVTITVIEEPGEHTVKVDGLTESFTVTAPPGFTLSPGYIAGILILILIAGTTTYTLYRRGRLSPPKSPPG